VTPVVTESTSTYISNVTYWDIVTEIFTVNVISDIATTVTVQVRFRVRDRVRVR
jgi:hypothetical protein